MGKRRVVKMGESNSPETASAAVLKRRVKKMVSKGTVYVNSTYNNTIITFTDENGGVIFWASAGSLGFSGTKKGTPYAAAKVAELLAEKARGIGLSDVDVFVKGIGAGRESAIRSLSSHGLIIEKIKDLTPIPFNGPKPPKVRRV